MFRSFWFSILSAILILAAGTASLAEDLSKVYTNAEKGFSLRYPAKWEIKETTGEKVLEVMSPLQASAANQYRPTVTISIETLSEPMSIADYATNRFNQLHAQITDLKSLKTGRQVISHTNARWWVITCKENTFNLKGFLFIVMKGNRAFTISALSTVEQYTVYKDVLADIGASLTIY